MHTPSFDLPPAEQTPAKKKSSAESPEASGTIGGTTPEQAASLRKTIEGKEKLRDGLIKAYSEKFKEYVAKREEREATQATLESQRLAGTSKITEAQMEEFRANDEKMDADDLHHAENYKRDAVDTDKEIDALKNQLEDEAN